MFRYPWVWLLAVPVLGWFWLQVRRRGTVAPSVGRWQSASRSWRARWWWVPEVWDGLVLLTLIGLLAGPESPALPQGSERRGASLAVVLDRSGSMEVMVDSGGQKISRFNGVKAVLRDFFHRRPDDAVTLISFAGSPQTHTPLTSNPDILIGFLDLIPLALDSKEGGTAIGDALILACGRLKNARVEGEASAGAIILLTDGVNNAGQATPEAAAQLASSLGIKIFPIGLGGTGFYPGQVSEPPVDLDVPTLKRLAQMTGGTYYQADNLAALTGLMKQLESQDLVSVHTVQSPVKQLDLAAGLWLLLVGTLGAPLIRFRLFRRGLP